MLHDYWMRQPDTTVLRRTLPGLRAVLDWYAPYLRDTGLVRFAPGWQFVDWRPGLSEQPKKGEAPHPDSCIISLLYLGALKDAADLEGAVGDPARRAADLTKAEQVKTGVQAACWVPERGLYADTPQKTSFSQHANALAVLYDVAPKDEQQAILEKVTVPGHGIDAPAGITGTTYYFSYYLGRALEHAGLGERYLDMLGTWRGLLAKHFTTWPEEGDPSRSDSHAWSAHPTEGLLSIVAGIEPAAPGYGRVRIAPHLGGLTSLDAAAAVPQGLVEVRYVRSGAALEANVTLPQSLSGEFIWAGRGRPLHPGLNRLRLPNGRGPGGA
jgi:alpha-L-rhamnosidase